MRTFHTISGIAALLFVVSVFPARADESNKLTYLTFSAPVDLPGISLPAGKYRFELADPVESRRVIKVSSEDGMKTYGMFLSVPNTMRNPVQDTVVMFKETARGMPHAIKAWFYPNESNGYEFVYAHDQALKIAKATHQSVLASDENDRNKLGRVNQNDQFAAITPSGPASANSGAITTVDRSGSQSASASQADTRAVGTSGRQSATSRRRELPRTASMLPWVAIFAAFLLGAGLGVRSLRTNRG